jgi:photosystem II stability/assembly factor-like uncharacterized protein
MNSPQAAGTRFALKSGMTKRLIPKIASTLCWVALCGGLSLGCKAKATVGDASKSPPPTTKEIPAYLTASWQSTGGPVGGLGYDIRMTPGSPDIMYVTDSGAGAFKSTDGGKNWTAINNGIDPTGLTLDQYAVFSLTVDPNLPNRIWAGTDGSGTPYRSDDGGKTWQKYNNGLDGLAASIRGFTVEKGNSNVVYFGAEIQGWAWNGSDIGIGNRTKGVVYKSTDAGENWKQLWMGDNLARYILIDPNNNKRLYVSTGIFDRDAANSSIEENIIGGVGLVRSDDGGETWTILNEKNGFAKGDLYLGSLAMHPTKSKTLLASGQNPFDGPNGEALGGVYLTTDGGDNWKEVLDDPATVVEYCEGDPNIAYAASIGRVYASQDGGATFSMVKEDYDPPGYVVGTPIDMQCDPRDAKRIFINSYGGGNFLSTDGGKNWITAAKGYTGARITDLGISSTSSGHVYATGRSGVFATTDGGENWYGIGNGPAHVFELGGFAVDPSDADHILLPTHGVHMESFDGGKNWTMHSEKFASLGLTSAAEFIFSKRDPKTVFALNSTPDCWRGGIDPCLDTKMAGLAVSRDGGETWSKSMGDGHVVSMAISTEANGPIYAVMVNKGVFRSDDNGINWTLVASKPLASANDISGEFRGIVALGGKSSSRLYLGLYTSGIGISDDGGKTWRASSAGMDPTTGITDFAMDTSRPDIVYAGTDNGGLFISTDGGKTWKAHNDGLTNRSISKLALSADGSALYAGTDGAGIFRLGTP